MKIAKPVLGAVLCLTSAWGASARAQTGSYALHEKGLERINTAQNVAPLSVDTVFGDQISRYNGSVEFNHVDISVPGNNALPVELRRNLSIDNRLQGEGNHLGGFGEWDLDIPHLSGVFADTAGGWQVPGPSPNQRCSVTSAPKNAGMFAAEDYWQGYQMHVPGAGSQSLLYQRSGKVPSPTSGTTYPWITKDMWLVSCLTSTKNGYPGEAYLAVSPDGVSYQFDWVISKSYASLSNPAGPSIPRKVIYFLASRIQDRHGNWVDLTYSGDKLTGVTSNDGRFISLSYSGDKIIQVTSSIGTWNYGYNGGTLNQVTLPDNSKWTFSHTGSLVIHPPVYVPPVEDAVDDCPELLEESTGSYALSVTHPSGATGQFSFAVRRHHRNNVAKYCIKPSASYEYLQIPNYFESFTLTSKAISGPGLTSGTWTYSYGDGDPLAFADQCTPPGPFCNSSKTNEIVGPDNHYERNEFGVLYGVNDGQLLKRETGSNASNILKTVSNVYISNAEAPSQAFPDEVGINPLGFAEPDSMKLRPLKSSTTTQDGVTYVSSTTAFDPFARPTSVTRSSNISYGYARTDVTEYHDDLSKWVLGQVKRSYAGGAEVSETEFNANAQPYRVFRYNNATPTQTLTYNADGTIATVKDGNNNVTVLSSWKRGIPQSIQYPATPESPSGSTESAFVNDSGWITSTTDENGYTTNYGYDAMGRVSSITQPTGDSVNWNTTTRAFEQISTPEMGLPAGHWRQSISTGNARSYTYYDALWRPVASESYDLGDHPNSQSQVFKRYDTSGREVFASYPTRGAADFQAVTAGTTTDYDSLDRPIQVRQTSELGTPATTTTEYLAGGEIRITNPRGQQTRTRYAAWDQPTTDYPVEIFHPEGAVTQIWRDYFFKPTQIRRSGTYAGQTVEAIRKYEYDALHRLCRVDEPETGSTVTGYDYNGNLTWSASGLTTLAATGCEHMAAYQSGRRSDRVYDARNRVTDMSFPDGNGNQHWDYTKDGLPSLVRTWNNEGSTIVDTVYTYNKRRLLTKESLLRPYEWAIGYGYDQNGSLAAQTYPTGLALNYAPNALGQATQVATVPGSTTTGTYASGVSYYPNGAIKQFTYGNGIVHTMTQNARQLPAESVDGANIVNYSYRYDANANVDHIADHITGTPTLQHRYMQYDGLDRLTAAGSAMFGGSSHWINYTYDPIDNIRSVSHPAVREHSYWYDTNNRLTNVQNTGGASVVGLSYDVQGNLANKNGQQYGFDYGNRLRWVMGKESYRYDSLGRRSEVIKDDGSVHVFQYSRAGQPLFSSKVSAAGVQTTHENIYLSGSVIATIDHNWPSNTVIATKYQHTDALGSPVAVTDTSGAVIERTNYEPYGSPINKTIDGIGYTGHVMDGPTGLTYMQQRYYDATLGRFLSVDPVTANSGTGTNFNRYWYAANNPYKFTDPDGRQHRPDRGSMSSHPGISSQVRSAGPVGSLERSINSHAKAPEPSNPTSTIAGVMGSAADGASIAADKGARNVAQYGWQAGEDAAMWRGMSRSLGKLGTGAGVVSGSIEIYEGKDLGDIGHGAGTIIITVAAAAGLISAPVAITIGGIDLAAQQAEYTSTIANPGVHSTGWRAINAAGADAILNNAARDTQRGPVVY